MIYPLGLVKGTDLTPPCFAGEQKMGWDITAFTIQARSIL